MSLSPRIQQSPVPGLVFDRNLAHQFKVLTSPAGDYYWKPHLMAVIRRCQDLAYFLPSAEFSDSASRVLFTRFSGNDELLTKTAGLDQPGVKMPESAYAKLQDALAVFKAMAGDPGLTPDESRFIAEFRLPDRNQFPGAYRVLKTNWYSSDRLFVLWGLEPGSDRGTPVIKILSGSGNAPSTPAQSEKNGERDQRGGPNTLPPKSPSNESHASSGFGAVPVGSGTGGGYGSGAAGSAGASFGDGRVVVVSDRWKRWRGCLWLLLPILLILLLLLLLSQCAPSSCSGSDQDLHVGQVDRKQLAVPPVKDRKESLQKQQEKLKDQPDSVENRKRQQDIARALMLQERAQDANEAYEESERKAESAGKKADESNDPADRKLAEELRSKADVVQAEKDAAEKKAVDAFRAPQESARREKLDKINEQQAVIDADKEQREADDRAKRAESSADTPADKAKAAELRSEADALKAKADKILDNAKNSVKSPEEMQELDALRDATPQKQKALDGEREELDSQLYVIPKNSPDEGEVLVRRFRPDEIVPKAGIRLHLEADANGRSDFKVKGWRLGLSPQVETSRLEAVVPVGPDLEIDVPLDLTFEYRGRDGKIHEDSAPFTLEGDVTIVPRIKINKYKEDAQPKVMPREKPNPKMGA